MKSLNSTLWNDARLEELESRDEYGLSCFCFECVCYCFTFC